MKKLAILGSTGSIGRQTLDVVRAFPKDFQVLGLAAGANRELLTSQVEEFRPTMVSSVSELGVDVCPGIRRMSMDEMVIDTDIDMVIVATVGRAGLVPTMLALEHGKWVALANKEVIIMAGELLKGVEKRFQTAILPVDSEPSAIWQCLRGEDNTIGRVIITASGGPFRTSDLEALEHVTPEEALKHPTWRMGRKITVDSATLMNKAFEVIETHCLFGVPWDKIEVVVHPQSIIHSMVEFVDGSVKAQLGPPDMRLPIQYAMFYPDRHPNAQLPKLDIGLSQHLSFEPLELDRYPCFTLAVEAGKKGGTYPTVLCAADELAVEMFLEEKIGFMDIPRVIDKVLESHNPSHSPNLEEILEIDQWSRARTVEVVTAMSKPGVTMPSRFFVRQ
jgi:1-deoxy-D-xylulose-5-phosphate reductoisomerase